MPLLCKAVTIHQFDSLENPSKSTAINGNIQRVNTSHV